MASDLRDALEEIASESRPDAPATDLWRRGRTRHRRRKLASGLAVVALLAGGVAGWAAWPDPTDVPVVKQPRHEPALPDRLYSPNEWTKGTAEVGPPGRIAALYWDQGERRDRSTGDATGGIMAISAIDGSYRYLDVQGSQRPEGWLLSPGGRYVAFWTRTSPVEQVPADPADGVHVYDAETGDVIRHEVDTPLGLQEGVGDLVWLDEGRLVVPLCAITEIRDDGSTCTAEPTQVWDVRTDDVVATFKGSPVLGPGGDKPLVYTRREGYQTVDLTSGARQSVTGIPEYLDRLVLSPDGTRFAGLGNTGDVAGDGDDEELRWGRLAEGKVHRTELFEVVDLYGWTDETSVVVSSAGGEQWAVDRVELESGQRTPFLRFDDGFLGAHVQLADDLLTEPMVEGLRPPDEPAPVARALYDWREEGLVGLGVVAAVWLLRPRRRRASWS